MNICLYHPPHSNRAYLNLLLRRTTSIQSTRASNPPIQFYTQTSHCLPNYPCAQLPWESCENISHLKFWRLFNQTTAQSISQAHRAESLQILVWVTDMLFVYPVVTYEMFAFFGYFRLSMLLHFINVSLLINVVLPTDVTLW